MTHGVSTADTAAALAFIILQMIVKSGKRKRERKIILFEFVNLCIKVTKKDTKKHCISYLK